MLEIIPPLPSPLLQIELTPGKLYKVKEDIGFLYWECPPGDFVFWPSFPIKKGDHVLCLDFKNQVRKFRYTSYTELVTPHLFHIKILYKNLVGWRNFSRYHDFVQEMFWV